MVQEVDVIDVISFRRIKSYHLLFEPHELNWLWALFDKSRTETLAIKLSGTMEGKCK